MSQGLGFSRLGARLARCSSSSRVHIAAPAGLQSAFKQLHGEKKRGPRV